MATEILMPKLGLTMKTGTIVSWFKSEGDSLAPKEPVLEIETEKLSYNIESPAGGILLKKLAEVGEKYPVAAVLGYVGQPDEKVTGPQPDGGVSLTAVSDGAEISRPPPAFSESAAPVTGTRVFISPLAKKLAAEMGIDYARIKGTGPNGRIVKADITAYSGQRAAPPVAVASVPAAPVPARTESASAVPAAAGTIIPYAGLRRAVGETMMGAWSTIPMVTHQVRADAGTLMEYRAMVNAGVVDKLERVTIGELLIKLTAAALAAMPVMNSSLTAGGIVLHEHVNVGMATAMDDGLIVPVLHDADKQGLLTLSRKAKALAVSARSGTLTPDEVYGGTFTVSNLGGYASVDYFTPIINPPQAAILGIGRVVDSVVTADGVIKTRPTVGLSITYDHRIVDGATAADFIRSLMKLMESPARAAPAID